MAAMISQEVPTLSLGCHEVILSGCLGVGHWLLYNPSWFQGAMGSQMVATV